MILFIFLLAAYLIGSVSFAVIVCRCMDLPDPRSYGSNNPGATNVLRSGKKKAAVLTLLGDAMKGWIAVALTAWLLPMTFSSVHTQAITMQTITQTLHTAMAGAGVLVVLGHMWPVFFRFKGGKGVATAFGVLLAFSPWIALGVLAVWLLVAFGLKISSLAALIATASAPLLAGLGIYAGWLPAQFLPAVLVIAALVVWRHKSNILKLIHGTETKLKN